jgi:hypothetical protein
VLKYPKTTENLKPSTADGLTSRTSQFSIQLQCWKHLLAYQYSIKCAFFCVKAKKNLDLAIVSSTLNDLKVVYLANGNHTIRDVTINQRVMITEMNNRKRQNNAIIMIS